MSLTQKSHGFRNGERGDHVPLLILLPKIPSKQRSELN